MRQVFSSALLTLFLFTFVNVIAQPNTKVPFTTAAWEIDAKKHEFKTIEGKEALYLENGKARLKDVNLQNGIIDFDILFPKGRKFVGFHFRIVDDRNYEEFYIRPHQSGNPDANQYTPVFNGLSGWQLYHGEGHGAAYAYKFDQWMHIRLVIADDQMEVFLEDMSKPLLFVPDLKMKTQSGKIGFGCSGPVAYANLTYQKIDTPKFISPKKELPIPEQGTIMKWQVSNTFSVDLLDKIYDLKKLTNSNPLSWQSGDAEFTGTLNIAKFSPRTKEKNVVLTKVIINAESDQVKALQFGYSDATSVFVNGQLIYAGHNKFRSRDYRYLGTIGYFDSIYLQLKKGPNEVVFAVAENFGGWGIKAKLEDMEGVRLE